MFDLTIGSASSTVITKPLVNNPRNANDVDFEVKYPKGYGGPRHMKEGITVVSKEVAEKFVALGIGRIVTGKETETAVPVEESVAEEKPVVETETAAEESDKKDGKSKAKKSK